MQLLTTNEIPCRFNNLKKMRLVKTFQQRQTVILKRAFYSNGKSTDVCNRYSILQTIDLNLLK